ncbi:hypothetical protein Poli38472_011169 [Pythium oligandrum]|uniref:Uncharacterized protein n=1 Tax=Pythium oligandrum TaxID=41045 RepID=A0A8K1CQT1_PYTOL|nr:hypothetical protein Poli38472_011169 [Pythium oligandrum]|eukprot:TMW67549.1 hypothetical protein Poli38472_011169 [Pythium oligandrum]
MATEPDGSWLYGRYDDLSPFINHHDHHACSARSDSGECKLSLVVSKPLSGRSPQYYRQLRNDLLVAGTLGFGSSTSAPWNQAVQYHTNDESVPNSVTRTLTPRITFDFGFVTARDLEWKNTLCHLFGYDGRNSEFLSECKLLQEQFPDNKAHLPSIPIRFIIPTWGVDSLGDQLQILQKLIILVQRTLERTKQAEESHPERPRFKLETMIIEVPDFYLTSKIVRQLQALMTLDVKIEFLVPPKKTVDENNVEIPGWRSAWASLLFTVFGHPQATIVSPKPVEKFVLTFAREAPVTMYEAFFSVVVHATSVTKIYVMREYSYVSPTQWRWLLYALFSRASTTSVKEVGSLTHPLLWTFEDVDVASVVNATHPVTQLHPDSTSADDKYLGIVRLQQGAKIQISKDPSDTIEVTNPDGQSFEIIRRGASGLICILVPGYGYGWVDRATTYEKRMRFSSSRPSPSPSPSLSQSAVECIEAGERDFYQHEPAALVQLWLPHIGRHLKDLRVSVARDAHDEVLQDILAHCPNLESLTIGNFELKSLQLLQDAFEKHACQIKSLIMDWCSTDVMALATFIASLADRKTVISKRLQRLELSQQMACHDLPMYLLCVLHFNDRLHHVRAYMWPCQVRWFNEMAVKDDYDLRTRIVGISLPIEAKSAFLSVFSPINTASCTVKTALDRDVISTIFEMAARPVQRKVVIEETPHEEEEPDHDHEMHEHED